MTAASPADAKTLLRLQMRGRRKQLSAAAPEAGRQAAEQLPEVLLAQARIVAGYRPQGAEIDPWPVMQAFQAAGAGLALPVALDRTSALVFRAFRDGDPLIPDAFGIDAPAANAPLVRPDLIITPLLAFDRAGARMGQGAGHYDRTIQALRGGQVFVLGLAFAGQEVARLPTETHDQPMDAILTETRYIEAS